MGIAVELGGMDAVLHHDELDIGHVEAGLLLYFTFEGGLRWLTPLDLTSRDSPEVRPFVSLNHEHLICRVEDQRTHSPDGILGPGGRGGWSRWEPQIGLLEQALQLAQMFDNQVGLLVPELRHSRVTSEYGAGEHAGMVCRLDVMLHIPDEDRLLRPEAIFLEHAMNPFFLVPSFDVRAVDEPMKPGHLGLSGIMVSVDRAEHKRAKLSLATEFEKPARVRKFADMVLNLAELTMIPFLQLAQLDVRRVPLIEPLEGKTEVATELLQSERSNPRLLKNVVGRFPYRREIVDQRAGPIEDDIT